MDQDRSSFGIPRIDIVFPDGHEDQIVLQRHFVTDLQSDLSCNYLGHLVKDKESCIAVTGCPGESMYFTIHSSHNFESNKFILYPSGVVETIANIDDSFIDDKQDPDNHNKEITLSRNSVSSSKCPEFPEFQGWFKDKECDKKLNNIDCGYDGGDCCKDTNDKTDNCNCLDPKYATCTRDDISRCKSLPSTNLINLKFNYDDPFLKSFKDKTQLKEYITNVITHTQSYFCFGSTFGSDKGLGTKFQLKVFQWQSFQVFIILINL